ncbi:unnamed protein product, partial [Ectocarpus sp. 13 AM-2016]
MHLVENNTTCPSLTIPLPRSLSCQHARALCVPYRCPWGTEPDEICYAYYSAPACCTATFRLCPTSQASRWPLHRTCRDERDSRPVPFLPLLLESLCPVPACAPFLRLC